MEAWMSSMLVSSCRRTALHLSAALAMWLVAGSLDGRAQAQDSAYCRKTRARARGDAALLIWPRIVAEAIRFPASGRVDIGLTVGDNIQARLAGVVAPLDIYRGARLGAVADADCARHESGEQLRELFAQGMNQEMLRAFRAQADYLQSRRSVWAEIQHRAHERLQAGLITVSELHELRRFVAALDRKLELVSSQASRLEVQTRAVEAAAWPALLDAYMQRSMRLEREMATLRSLDPWALKLSAGVIPLPGQPLDWYGFLEVGYSLGGIARGQHEAEYLEARRQELKAARYELPGRAQELRRSIDAEIDNAQRELRSLAVELGSIAATRAALEVADVPAAEHARAMLAAEEMFIEADRVFLRALVQALVSLRAKTDRS
jgi:hypothetical protein